MAISHVFAEGIGPFKSVHLDLRGLDGKPSLGPHILAGVNGSGKSTLLKAIAWCAADRLDAFPAEEWVHYLRSDSVPRVLVVLDFPRPYRVACAITNDRAEGWEARLREWAYGNLDAAESSRNDFGVSAAFPRTTTHLLPPEQDFFNAVLFGGPDLPFLGLPLNITAYSSVPSLRHIEHPEMAIARDLGASNSLSFQSTIQNDAVQSWLREIATESQQPRSTRTAPLEALQRGLKRVCGKDVSVAVDIEPDSQLWLRIGSQTLNFSQIPDGVRVTLGWLADVLMRADSAEWQRFAGVSGGGGVLLFDEIEGFLHPLWQRNILPALREALPATQSVVTSHSPFVISSCPGSMIHVLNVNGDGTAYVERRVPAPVGESITSTLKDIFGVESRFDVDTEKQLAEWNELKKAKMQQKLSPAEEGQFRKLSEVLASRSEELRSLVTTVPELPKATVDSLTQMSETRRSKKSSLVTR
jgi:predicted ATP-binding protein involved in virulence